MKKILIVFLLFPALVFSQTKVDSVDILILPNIPVASVDTNQVIPVLQLFGEIPRYRKWTVGDLKNWLDSIFVNNTEQQSKVDSLGGLIASQSVPNILETTTANGNYLLKYWGNTPSVMENLGVITISQPIDCVIDKFTIHGGVDLLSPSNVLTIQVNQVGVDHSTTEVDANYFSISVIERASSNNVQLGLNSSGFQVRHKSVGAGSITMEITGLNGLVDYSIVGN